MKLKVAENILSLKPYKPGKPIEELEREYGIKNTIKLASNENPIGSSPKAVAAMREAMRNLHRYPDGSGYYLVEKLSEKLGVPKQRIVIGNGSDDVIGMLTRVYLSSGDEAVMTDPSFLMYEIYVKTVNAVPVFVPLTDLSLNLSAMADAVTDKTRMIFITNPNNPTGSYIKTKEFETFMEKLSPEVVVVLDEAYIEFARDPECLNGLTQVAEDRPIAVLRTFSKAYGLAGIRIGYGLMSFAMAAMCNRVREPFNTNSLAQAGAAAALDDEAFLKKTCTLIHTELAFLQDQLKKMEIAFFPTQSNFFLIDVKADADDVFESMLKRGVIVRSMVSYGFPEYIRVNVGTRKENERFLQALEMVLKKS
ncbi:MAG: histidinol-phosphate transaminase [Desulfobacteraceae bacterium]|nr:histidinol-phosphate transaminase [Desulfobacteraceae bacterium]MBC2755246.1 histidinol-phosphate transaminase [Desulfobacteraceae bacterium]